MENKNDTAAASSSSNGGVLCIDFCLLVTVSILYGVGKDNSWGVRAGEFLLIYILLKSAFILTRWITLGVSLAFVLIASIVNIVFNLLWIIGVNYKLKILIITIL